MLDRFQKSQEDGRKPENSALHDNFFDLTIEALLKVTSYSEEMPEVSRCADELKLWHQTQLGKAIENQDSEMQFYHFEKLRKLTDELLDMVFQEKQPTWDYEGEED